MSDRVVMDSKHILTDEQLIVMAREGSETAQEILIEKYKGLVSALAKSYFIVGADKDDVVQEGMIGLFKAIQKFDPEREASFKTFADTCITSQILSAIKTANRKKHQPLNESISIDKETEEDEEITIADSLKAPGDADPEALLIFNEASGILTEGKSDILSDFEKKVLLEKFEGFNLNEIALHLDKTPKQIDNAIQRAKKKIIAYLEK